MKEIKSETTSGTIKYYVPEKKTKECFEKKTVLNIQTAYWYFCVISIQSLIIIIIIFKYKYNNNLKLNKT